MKVLKIMDIMKENEIIGVIQEEKYNEDLTSFVVNTKSVSVCFNTLEEAMQYIEKFNYKAVTKDVNVEGYKVDNVEIVVNDKIKTFKNIYTNLLLKTIEKGFLNNFDYKYLNIKGVFDETVELLNSEVLKQWMTNKNVLNYELSFEEVEEMQELSYELNKEVIKTAFKKWFYIIDNSITGLTIAAY